MFYYAISASLVSTLCFGLVLFVQICRIDDLKRRCNELASDRLVHDNRLKLQQELISENCKHTFAIESKVNDLERAREATPREVFFVGGGGGVCNSVAHGTNGRPGGAQFTAGEPHPFAADAFVSADEVLA